jgi:hypothetical protein
MGVEQDTNKTISSLNTNIMTLTGILIGFAILLNIFINALILFKKGRTMLIMYIILIAMNVVIVFLLWMIIMDLKDKVIKFKDAIVKFINDKERELNKLTDTLEEIVNDYST